MRLHAAIACLAAAVCWCGSQQAAAQTPSPMQEWQYPGGIILQQLFGMPIPKWRRVLGVASSLEPIYDGSHAYRVSGGPVINIRYRNIAFASDGEGIGVNVIHASHLHAGVAIGYDLGRSTSSDYHLRGLPDIDPAVVPKVFAEWAVARKVPLILRADVRRMIRRGDGYIGDVEVYSPLPGSSRRFIMFAGLSYTFADSRHMQETFGVTAAQARDSGLAAFTPKGGVYATGLGFSATLFITQHWLLNIDAATDHLLNGARASPITERSLQRSIDLATAYQW